MDSINDRIALLMTTLKYNNNSFAKALGVNPTVTFNIIGGRKNSPSYDFIKKLLLSFENISPLWLIKGEGEMFVNQIGKPSIKEVFAKESTKCEFDVSETINILKEQLKISNDTNKDLLVILKNISQQ